MQTHSSLRTALLAVIAAGLLAMPAAHAQSAVGACGDASAPYAEFQVGKNPQLDLLLATNQQQREQGLGDLPGVPHDTGMLFVYDFPSTESYWMYHTLFPLSIAWIDQNGTILDIQDMAVLNNPYDQQEAGRFVHTPAVLPYWYALEVNEGWFVENGVAVGQQVLFCLGGA